MAQEQIQEQQLALQQKLAQSITQQQILQTQLTELPITQLLERINTEMNDNPALEVSSEPQDHPFEQDSQPESEGDTDDYEREQRQQALDDALAAIGRDDDELPVYYGGQENGEKREEMVYGQTDSFIDLLNEQMGMLELTEEERNIMEYLIGSLDDDGLLRKTLDSVSDELAIYQNIDTTPEKIEHVLQLLQQFDPAGIGARTLQECLLLQVERREPSRLTELMEETLRNHFEQFTLKHWDKLQQSLKLNDVQAKTLIDELRKLNPKPGASFSESIGHSMQQITPDFIIETQDDGNITFTLNSGDVPELRVSKSFTDILQQYQKSDDKMSRQMREALIYTKNKIDSALGFIEAIRVRQHTLTVTMRAIIQWQHRFFEDGDEASLRPMILKDIAEKTGLDVSTISRVSSSKYALTRWGTFPLRYFFSDSFVSAGGEELSARKIKITLRNLIDAEDKRHPLSDDALKQLLAEKGFPIARRTTTKYRELLGIPVARLRRQ